MNILEAYLKKYKQIIILILGLPCTNKSEIAKELSSDLGLELIKINDYLIKDKFKEIDIEGTKIKLYEDVENYDWDKLNSSINQSKSNGIILYGNYLDIDKIDSEMDFIFFYSTNMTTCKKILVENKMIEFSDSVIDIFFEKVFNPLYENIKNNMKINKFFNIKEETTFDETYDDTFDIIMKLITKKLK